MNKWALGGGLFLVASIAITGWQGLKTIDHLNVQLSELETKNTQLLREVDNQSAIIATHTFQFQRVNHISQIATRHGIIQRAEAEERKIEYKTILKKEPTCDLPVPLPISDRLLSNTYRLRASAMHPDTQNANSASSAISARRVLTYCDLALWIDPLLTDLAQANAQLKAIEQIEEVRQHEKTDEFTRLPQ